MERRAFAEMLSNALIYGPAYLDTVVEIGQELVADPSVCLDQSLPAAARVARADGLLVIDGPTGDHLVLTLPRDVAAEAATYHTLEPVLARLSGGETKKTVSGVYPVMRVVTQVGGMGAGYAQALAGTLRAPFGHDAVGERVIRDLSRLGLTVAPCLLAESASDTSLVLLSPQGDKLAIGVRDAMVRWRMTPEDAALLAQSTALVLCGAPNHLMAEILALRPALPVMCAPAMRNVCDNAVPLASVADGIHYLTLNALEWSQLADQEEIRAAIPVITLTDGPRESRIFLREQEIRIPALPCDGPANTNRAGETYGSTFFKVLCAFQPDFWRVGRVEEAVASMAGHIAAEQAARQLQLTGFAFPPDDWVHAV